MATFSASTVAASQPIDRAASTSATIEEESDDSRPNMSRGVSSQSLNKSTNNPTPAKLASAGDSSPDIDNPASTTRPRGKSLQEKYHPVDAAGKPLHAKIVDNATIRNPHHTHLDTHHPSPVRTPSPSRLNGLKTIGPSKLGKTELMKIDKYADGKTHVLVGATGSVASVKIPLIVKSLLAHENVEVQIITTKSAKHFFDVEKMKNELGVKVWEDDDDWKTWHELSDPILHIELRRWAHLLLIAPTSANTLAKIANGLCDNLLVPSKNPLFLTCANLI
jgi:Flavoprotein